MGAFRTRSEGAGALCSAKNGFDEPVVVVVVLLFLGLCLVCSCRTNPTESQPVITLGLALCRSKSLRDVGKVLLGLNGTITFTPC